MCGLAQIGIGNLLGLHPERETIGRLAQLFETLIASAGCSGLQAVIARVGGTDGFTARVRIVVELGRVGMGRVRVVLGVVLSIRAGDAISLSMTELVELVEDALAQ